MNGKEGGDCARELTLSGFNTDKARTKHVNLVNFFFSAANMPCTHFY